MNWEGICRNLTFTVENKMGNLHKKRWPHFKLNKMFEIFHFVKV